MGLLASTAALCAGCGADSGSQNGRAQDGPFYLVQTRIVSLEDTTGYLTPAYAPRLGAGETTFDPN